jgi:D-amino-acid dehydrogenase
MAETYKVAMSHFSERIRTAESAELGGFDKQLSEKRKATIALAVSDIFTQAGAI